jgi:uncharacterized protein (TIGR02246 family)
MYMKEHILAALREQFNRWEELLAGLKDEQIRAPQTFGDWSIKDVVVHLWAWQQRSIARLEAALADKEPVFPKWQPGLDPDAAGSADQVNAWIYNTYREQSWESVYQNWHDGYLRLLSLAEQISERDLLDTSRYTWLEGYSLVLILLASYDHHQEHLEKLPAGQIDHEWYQRSALSVYRALLEAWNRRQAADFAALFGDTGSCVGFDGSPMNGRTEIETTLHAIFKDHPTAAYVAKVREVRTLAAGVTLVRAVAGMIPPGKQELNPAANAVQSLVMVASNAGWQIALFQNTPAAFHGRPEMSVSLTDELTAVAGTGTILSID